MMKCKRSFMGTVFMLLAMMLLFSSVSIKCNAASKVRLSSKKVVLTKGKSKKLKLKNAKQKKIRWKSSNKSIATVSKKGKVTARKKGTVRIIARYGKKKYICQVTVKNLLKTKSNAKLNRTSLGITKGKKATISVTGAKGKITSCKVTSSSIATAKRSGCSKVVITAKKKGHTKLKVKVDGKTLTCNINVSDSFNYTQIEKNNKAVADKITVKVETSLQYPEKEREIRDNVNIPSDRKTFDTIKITITNNYSKSVKLKAVSLEREDGQEMIQMQSFHGKKRYDYLQWKKLENNNSAYYPYVLFDASWPGSKASRQGYLIVEAGKSKSITYRMNLRPGDYSKEDQIYYRNKYGEDYLENLFQFEVLRPNTKVNMTVIAYPYTSSNWSTGKGPGMVGYIYSPWTGKMKTNYYN